MPYFFSLSLFIYLQISMAYLSNTLAMSQNCRHFEWSLYDVSFLYNADTKREISELL